MGNEVKPIKRSKELAPLSREHHDGLLCIWKIRQGLKNNTPLETLRRFTLFYWHHHIKPHFSQEEKILAPKMPEGHPLTDRLKGEHAHIRELILQIDKETERQTFAIFCDLIDKHIRFEEREFFVFLESHLNKEQLAEIYEQLVKNPLSCEPEPAWNDEFWLAKK